jgi:hypothetical protein
VTSTWGRPTCSPPDIKAGDVATASVVDAATSTRTPFLRGTFVQD